MNIKPYKIVLCGDSSVGKTTFLTRLKNDKFDQERRPTINADIENIQYTYNNEEITISIWDTAGQDRFYSLNDSYYRDAKGCYIFYDVTSFESFANVIKWLSKAPEKCQKILIGTKNDLVDNKKVETDDVQSFADENDIFFLETSSKTGENVRESLNEIIDLIMKNNPHEIEETGVGSDTVDFNKKKKRKKNCCSGSSGSECDDNSDSVIIKKVTKNTNNMI